jgi:hypothetical protein
MSNLVSCNNLSVANNLTTNGDITTSGNILTSLSIQANTITATNAINVKDLTITESLNNLSLQNLGSLDTTSSIQSQLNNKSADNTVVHLTNVNETIQGIKTFSNSPIVPNCSANDNSTKVANTKYVDTAISALVGSAPDVLNSLNELATALGNDPSFATTVSNQIGSKGGLATNNTWTGTNTLSNTLNVNGNIVANSKTITPTILSYISTTTSDLQTQLNSKAVDSNTVHKTANESIAGIKTFTNVPVFPNNTVTNSMINNSCINLGYCDATSSIQTQLNTEITNRTNAVTTVTNNLNTEITNRTNAVTTVTNNLNAEITNRINADTNLQNQVTALQQSSFAGYGNVTQSRSDGVISLVNSHVANPALDFFLYQGINGDTVLNTGLNQPLEFKVHNTEYMRLASNGNIGVRKTNPAYELDVNGQINGNQIFSNGLEMIPTAICVNVNANGTIAYGGGITVTRTATGFYLIKVDANIVPKTRGFPWVSGSAYSTRVFTGASGGFPTYDYVVICQGGGSQPNNEDRQFYFYLI